MEQFWKSAAGMLLGLIFWLSLQKQEKDISLLLTLAACIMAAGAALAYLEPVLNLMHQLENIGKLQDGMLGILFKAVGIGLTAELAGMVCADAGNGSMGKMIRLLGSSVILYLSIPVFQALMTLIQEILGTI